MSKQEPTGWVGWIFFASVMMFIVGGLQAISGLVGIFKDTYYVVAPERILVFDLNTWGWINLLIGLVILVAASAILVGKVWGRVVGVLLASVSLLANLAFVEAYPIWSIVAIVVNGLVIYALTMHGAELKD